MSLPKEGLPLELANGDTVKVLQVYYSTAPIGTYRVRFRVDGKDWGCKAWYRKTHYKEYVEGDAVLEPIDPVEGVF